MKDNKNTIKISERVNGTVFNSCSDKRKVFKRVDLTALNPCTSILDIKNLCQKAFELECASVCVPPFYCEEAAQRLKSLCFINKNKPCPAVCTVIGFPFGYQDVQTKAAEISSVARYADEVDIVMNQTLLKNFSLNALKNELRFLSEYTKSVGIKTVKVIVETCNLDLVEKIWICELFISIPSIDYIKTSTGYGKAGAELKDIELWKSIINAAGSNLKIKAAGGIRSIEMAEKFINAGADRIGASRLSDCPGVNVVRVRKVQRPKF